jgi:hypothetical protein
VHAKADIADGLPEPHEFSAEKSESLRPSPFGSVMFCGFFTDGLLKLFRRSRLVYHPAPRLIANQLN